MYSSQLENTVYYIVCLLAIQRMIYFETDVSACSEELNAVIKNTFFAAWKICRRTLRRVFQSNVQETESGVYEIGISKQ
jgi:hypothetical protein